MSWSISEILKPFKKTRIHVLSTLKTLGILEDSNNKTLAQLTEHIKLSGYEVCVEQRQSLKYQKKKKKTIRNAKESTSQIQVVKIQWSLSLIKLCLQSLEWTCDYNAIAKTTYLWLTQPFNMGTQELLIFGLNNFISVD